MIIKQKSIEECDDMLEWFTGVSHKQAVLNHKAVAEGYCSYADKLKQSKKQPKTRTK